MNSMDQTRPIDKNTYRTVPYRYIKYTGFVGLVSTGYAGMTIPVASSCMRRWGVSSGYYSTLLWEAPYEVQSRVQGVFVAKCSRTMENHPPPIMVRLPGPSIIGLGTLYSCFLYIIEARMVPWKPVQSSNWLFSYQWMDECVALIDSHSTSMYSLMFGFDACLRLVVWFLPPLVVSYPPISSFCFVQSTIEYNMYSVPLCTPYVPGFASIKYSLELTNRLYKVRITVHNSGSHLYQLAW